MKLQTISPILKVYPSLGLAPGPSRIPTSSNRQLPWQVHVHDYPAWQLAAAGAFICDAVGLQSGVALSAWYWLCCAGLPLALAGLLALAVMKADLHAARGTLGSSI